MKNLLLFGVGLAVVGLAVSAAPAQQRGGRGGTSMYLAAKSVQEELKLSEDDAKKITDALGGIDRNLSREERAEKTTKILADNLKEDQVKRLHQIMWQKEGIGRAIASPDVQAALKLDDKQKDSVKTIQDDAQKAVRDLGRGAGNRDKITEIRKKAGEDITAVLTEDQKKAWKDLQGPEFKGEIPRPGRPNPNP